MRDFEKKANYDMNYAKENLKRVPLNMTLDQYDILKKYCDSKGLKVSTFIKDCVFDKINADN